MAEGEIAQQHLQPGWRLSQFGLAGVRHDDAYHAVLGGYAGRKRREYLSDIVPSRLDLYAGVAGQMCAGLIHYCIDYYTAWARGTTRADQLSLSEISIQRFAPSPSIVSSRRARALAADGD